MVEVTASFKVEVKKLRSYTGVKGNYEHILPSKPDKLSEFTKDAREILKSINQLNTLIEEKQTEYIGSPCSTVFNAFTDKERLDFDLSSNAYIVQCKEAIDYLSKRKEDRVAGQTTSHREGVIEVLHVLLRRTCDKYSRVKAQHVAQAIERQKLSRLSSHRKTLAKIQSMEEVEAYAQGTPVGMYEQGENGEDLGLTEEERLVLEQENHDLYEEMTALSSEVKNIEGTVMEISRLQELFTEKVLTQAEQISEIHQTAVETTENVRSGNEELREAIRNNAGFRVWLLFFFVMASLCLLFLDWYS